MLALQATNGALHLCSQATGHLEPYAGPQCYPQLRLEARYRANEPKAMSGAEGSPTLPAARGQMRCWLRCDDCSRWRLIEREAFRTLDPTAFREIDPRRSGEGASINWAAWLEAAPDRFEAFRRGREMRAAFHLLPLRGVGEGELPRATEEDTCAPSLGSSVAPMPAAVAPGVVDAAVDGAGAGAASSGSESRHTSERGSGDEQPADDGDGFRSVLRGLGSRGGGLTQADHAELGRLLGGDVPPECAARAGDRRDRAVAFRCDMLMTRAAGADDDGGWRCMSCAGECDYQSILQRS